MDSNFRSKPSHGRTISLNTTSSAFNMDKSFSSISGRNASSNAFQLNKSRKDNGYVNLLNLTPASENPLYFSKYSQNRIKTQIHYVNQGIVKDGMPTGSFRNRPMININRPELDVNSRVYLNLSPTSGRKNFLTTSKVMKSYKEKKQVDFFKNYDNNATSFNSRFNTANNEFEVFAKGIRNKNLNYLYLIDLQPSNFRTSGVDKYSSRKKKYF
jgi:hypothetical protein